MTYPPNGVKVFLAALVLASAPVAAAQSQDRISDEILSEAYVYLLARALVVRQEQTDLAESGVDYNVVKYNSLGSADFVNPNLDVAYLEAWFLVDSESAAILTVPEIQGRYYTAQIVDEWGEVIANINERTYPLNPSGRFALVAPGSTIEVPAGAVRVPLHGNKAKMLARVELKDDADGAVALQHAFTVEMMGEPEFIPPVAMPAFDNVELIGVELFDHAEALLNSALDVSPVAAQMQARVMAVAEAIKDDEERARVDQVLRDRVIPDFMKFAITGAGRFRDGWLGTLVAGTYGEDFRTRTAANLVGIWANTPDEVIYFIGTRDASNDPLSGDAAYTLHFPADGLPDAVVHGYWSIILVDIPDYRVVPNELDRFNFNSHSDLQKNEDGSLTIHIASERPRQALESNWLPSPAGSPFTLTFRTYVPMEKVKLGEWFPSPVVLEN